MPKHVNTESLELMIGELARYREELETNRQLIAEAAIATDAVLGGGTYSQKYVSRIEEALLKITKTMHLAENVQTTLQYDLHRMIDATEL